MKEEREYAAVAYEPNQDKIFVMGGWTLDSCEYYDVSNNIWTQFAKLSEKKYYMSASILNNRFIYLFGGFGNGPLDTIEQYDITERKTWQVLTCKLQKGLARPGSVPISATEILIFGGYSNGW